MDVSYQLPPVDFPSEGSPLSSPGIELTLWIYYPSKILRLLCSSMELQVTKTQKANFLRIALMGVKFALSPVHHAFTIPIGYRLLLLVVVVVVVVVVVLIKYRVE